jgi:hypothetical protein
MPAYEVVRAQADDLIARAVSAARNMLHVHTPTPYPCIIPTTNTAP